MRIFVILALLVVILVAATPAAAQTIVYIPQDDRPVSLSDVVATARAAGVEIVTPPLSIIGNRTEKGEPERLLAWLLDKGRTADAVVVSSDALLYGSLVGSRTHHLPLEAIEERLAGFARFKAANPGTRLYVYGTIMRSPRASVGGVEPEYYEVYGPSIFRITALRDKAELTGLTRMEDSELKALLAAVPEPVLADWYARRSKNYAANVRLIDYVRDGTFAFLLLGRDDCSPFSQSHMESRQLARLTASLPASKYASFPGADQLGMVMLTRAVNNAAVRMPLVRVRYAPGAGPQTVPAYEDVPVGRTVVDHIVAAGGLVLGDAKPDLVLAVNTPEDGITYEANDPANRAEPGSAVYDFTAAVARDLRGGLPVTVADIAWANGADNALMGELARRGLLFRLAAYSGWNTASNTLGFAIGQGMLAPAMTPAAKDRLLATRLLDDWAYQANARGAVAETVLYPARGNYFYLDELTPRLAEDTDRRLRAFAAAHFPAYPLESLKVSFPWNRLFEIRVDWDE